MLRSMRLRLVLAFVAVVAVAIGIAEVVAERTATREFDAYVGRVDAVYIETLAQNLGDYYAANGSWQGVESVLEALPQVPGHLQLQDNSGTVVGDSSPGRGRGGPGGPPGAPVSTPTEPVGGPRRQDDSSGEPVGTPTATGPSPGSTAVPGGSPSGPGGPGGPDGTPTATGPSPGSTAVPGGSPSGPGGPGGPDGTPTATGPSGPGSPESPNTSPSPGPTPVPGGPSGPGGPGGDEPASGGGNPQSSGETGPSEPALMMVLAESPMASSGMLAAEASPTPQAAKRIPVYANGQQVGTLVVLSRNIPAAAASSSDRFFDRLRLALLVGGVTGLILAVVFATLLVGGITRPLRRLTDAARRIASGDFSQRVAVTSPSEAAELAASFNRMAETLERDQETRRRLLADIVHELRTPLSVIQGTAQGFLDGVIAADATHTGIIRDEASLLNKLITDLRDIALAESGELRLEKRPADLTDLARQAASAVQPRAREKGVELEVVAPDGLPLALVDSDRTLQIVGNLLENALRHTPSGGRVAVGLSWPRDGLLALEVSDTGEGIPPEHLPHVFERFYRADPARPAGGTGLGLAIVKQLTEAQGGSVSVESAPGRGSVFTITFPVSSLEAEPRP